MANTSAVFYGAYTKLLTSLGLILVAGQKIKYTDDAGINKPLVSAADGVLSLSSTLIPTSGTIATTPYTTALSWAGAGPYTMTVTGAAHGKGTKPTVFTRETAAGVSTDFLASVAITDATGDFTITSDTNPTGYVVVM